MRQMSAPVLNAGVITSTVAWPQTPHSRLTQRDGEQEKERELPLEN